MSTYLPFILVGLGVFSAVCVAFVAWELTKEASGEGDSADQD